MIFSNLFAMGKVPKPSLEVPFLRFPNMVLLSGTFLSKTLWSKLFPFDIILYLGQPVLISVFFLVPKIPILLIAPNLISRDRYFSWKLAAFHTTSLRLLHFPGLDLLLPFLLAC